MLRFFLDCSYYCGAETEKSDKESFICSDNETSVEDEKSAEDENFADTLLCEEPNVNTSFLSEETYYSDDDEWLLKSLKR